MRYRTLFVLGFMLYANIVVATTTTPEWLTPTAAEASGYDSKDSTGFTGPAELAIDSNRDTAWTLNAMGWIRFDLGGSYLVEGIDVDRLGHVTNGNSANVYVDGTQVLFESAFSGFTQTQFFTPTVGRFVTYETVAVPHNRFLQIATWSEVGEFQAYASPVPIPPALYLFGSGVLGLIRVATRKSSSGPIRPC